MMKIIAAALSSIALLSSCADQTEISNDPAGNPVATVAEPRYEVTTTVLDDGDGAELCLGVVAQSLPPQRSGIPVDGWSWRDVEGEESASGVTWGEFHVVGTFDGEGFALVDAGPPKPYPVEDGDRFAAPCPSPRVGGSMSIRR